MFKIIGSDGREYGPVSADTICQWVNDGRVNTRTMVLPDDAAEWRPLGSVPELLAVVEPPPLPKAPPRPPTANSGMNRVIPYRNAPALFAYYCAVFALIPVIGALLGLMAFVLGIFGLRAARRNPAAGGRVHSWIGIILGGLCGFGYLTLIVMFIMTANHY